MLLKRDLRERRARALTTEGFSDTVIELNRASVSVYGNPELNVEASARQLSLLAVLLQNPDHSMLSTEIKQKADGVLDPIRISGFFKRTIALFGEHDIRKNFSAFDTGSSTRYVCLSDSCSPWPAVQHEKDRLEDEEYDERNLRKRLAALYRFADYYEQSGEYIFKRKKIVGAVATGRIFVDGGICYVYERTIEST